MRALVLSGGGSKGAFHVGYCKRRIGDLGKHYDILCGVSAGNLVSAFLAQYPKGKEDESACDLERVFLNIENRDVWKPWFFGKVSGLWKSALLNAEPLQRNLDRLLDVKKIRASKRSLRVGAVSLTTGAFAMFDETHPHLDKAILASAAFPGFFAPVRIEDQWWTDGGVQQITPIKAAIDAGATEIEVVITDPEAATHEFDDAPEALDVIVRALELMTQRLSWIDVKFAQKINQLVKLGHLPEKREVKIYVTAPEQVLNRDSLHFDPNESRAMARLGYYSAMKLEASD